MNTATPAATLDAPLAPPAAGASVPRWVDYYELTKPRMNFLVVATTAVGVAAAVRPGGFAAGAIWILLVHALLGTALTAAGASVFNQWVERDVDRDMPRTRNRPLPAGRLRGGEAAAFAVLLSIAGVAYLAATVNLLTAGLGLLTLLIYVLVYTPMKRRTPWCTLVGAVPGAIPPMMGVTAVTGQITPLAWALFGILFVWQMPHFFALAIMFRDDYAAGGLKMLPVTDGLPATVRQIVGFSLLLLPVSLAPTLLGSAGWVYGAAALILGAAFLWCALACARTGGGRAEAKRLFFASILYLPALLAVLMLNKH